MNYQTMRARVDRSRRSRALRGRLDAMLDTADSYEAREAIQREYDDEIDRRIDDTRDGDVKEDDRWA